MFLLTSSFEINVNINIIKIETNKILTLLFFLYIKIIFFEMKVRYMFILIKRCTPEWVERVQQRFAAYEVLRRQTDYKLEQLAKRQSELKASIEELDKMVKEKLKRIK